MAGYLISHSSMFYASLVQTASVGKHISHSRFTLFGSATLLRRSSSIEKTWMYLEDTISNSRKFQSVWLFFSVSSFMYSN